MGEKIKKIQHQCNGAITKYLRKVSIFKRLTLAFLGLLIGAAVFLTFFCFDKYSKEILLNLEKDISMSAQNVQLKVQDIMRSYERTAIQFYEDEHSLKAVAENEELEDEKSVEFQKNKYEIESKLYHVGRGKKYIKNMQLVTPKRQYHMVEDGGYQRGGTIRNLDEFYQSDFYQKAKEKQGYPVWLDGDEQSSIFFENGQSVYGYADIITLCVAIYKTDNREFLGVLVMNVDIKVFSDIARGYKSYQEGNIFLTGKDGVLLGFNPSIAFPSFPDNREIFGEMMKNRNNVVRTEIKGRDVLLAYENIADTELFSVYIADMSTLLEGTYRIRNLCMLVLAIIVVVCVIISYYVTRSISDPVRNLIKVMGKAGDGKWTVRYQNEGNDEITVLGERFNEMVDKTNQLIEQVYLSEIRRQKLQLSWKNAQLDAMLMQINPHFLYNTLDIIRWEAMYEANGESRVTCMIEQFSKLCRMGMKAGANTISLKESIEHAKVYMDVINFRHQDKIKFETSISEEAETCYVPQFMLQPIIENAVVHGFGDGSKGYFIQISAKVKEKNLYIQVSDNGKGMKEEELEKIQKNIDEELDSEKNIGMTNVNQRIRLFYGESYGIQINSREKQGTEVRILLPVRINSETIKIFEKEVK